MPGRWIGTGGPTFTCPPSPIAGAEGVGEHPPISGVAHSSPKRSPGVFHPQNLPRPFVKVFNLTFPSRQRVRGNWRVEGRHASSPWTGFRF